MWNKFLGVVVLAAGLGTGAVQANDKDVQTRTIETQDLAGDSARLESRILFKMHSICGWYKDWALTHDEPGPAYRECIESLRLQLPADFETVKAFEKAKARM